MDRTRPSGGCDGGSTPPGSALTFLCKRSALRNDNALRSLRRRATLIVTLKKTNSFVNLIFEAATVKKLKRVGFQILGNGEEPLGEHIFTTSVIAYFLAKQMKRSTNSGQGKLINLEKVLIMSIFHDFHEARTGDVHKLQSLYVKRDQRRANEDLFKGIDNELLALLEEYEERKTLEAKLVYEANIIALLIAIKPFAERGDLHAKEWLEWNAQRLRIPEAIALAKDLIAGNSQDWWKNERVKLHHEYQK